MSAGEDGKANSERRTALLRSCESFGWPNCEYKPGATIMAGEENWRKFVETADETEIEVALLALQIRESSKQFEESLKQPHRIAARLKPFATGHASATDYDKIKSSGLPRPSEVFFLTSTPGRDAPQGLVPREQLDAGTICDQPLDLRVSIAQAVIDGRIGPGRPVENEPLAGMQFSPSFMRLALTYGYAGMVIQRAQRDPQLLVDDIVHVWSKGIGQSPDVHREIAAQVARNGPDALDGWSLGQPARDSMRRLLDRGVPMFLERLHQETVSVYTSEPLRTDLNEKIKEVEDLLTEIGVLWLLGFRWRWCTYRRDPHWYIAGHQEQYGCVRHREAVQQQRARRPKAG